MKRLIVRLLLFSLPFLILVAVELFTLPIDFFTFRVWEALKTDSLRDVLPGYFYPKMSVTKVESGDIGHHSRFAVMRKVEWQTDRFGYRNRDRLDDSEIVIIGDSNTAGSGLTQKDILSEALGDILQKNVYSFAPSSINLYLKERRFVNKPPRIVIVASIERNITSLRTFKKELAFPSFYQKMFLDLKGTVRENRLTQELAMPIDRIFKANMLNYSRSSLRRSFSVVSPDERYVRSEGKASSMLFLVGDKANADIGRGELERAVLVLRSYHELFSKRGARFIFLPIPNKENIYYDLLPSKKKPPFLAQLIESLNRAGIETIDTQQAFEEARTIKGIELYQPDDSHWGRDGVRIAAVLLARQVRGSR